MSDTLTKRVASMFDEKFLPDVDEKLQEILSAVTSGSYSDVKKCVDDFLAEYTHPAFKEGDRRVLSGQCWLLYPDWKEDWEGDWEGDEEGYEENEFVRATFLHGSKANRRLLKLLEVLVEFVMDSRANKFSEKRPGLVDEIFSYLLYRGAVKESDEPVVFDDVDVAQNDSFIWASKLGYANDGFSLKQLKKFVIEEKIPHESSGQRFFVHAAKYRVAVTKRDLQRFNALDDVSDVDAADAYAGKHGK